MTGPPQICPRGDIGESMHVWRMGCVTACDGVCACKCGQRLGCVVTWPPSGQKQGPGPAEKVPRAPVEIVGPPRRPAASVRKAQCDPWPGVSGGWGNGMMKA